MNTIAPQVPNHLVWAILSTLFCCLPAGIVSIVYAAQVNTKLTAGDITGAQDASDKARKWALWAAILGLAGIVVYVIATLALGGLTTLSNHGS